MFEVSHMPAPTAGVIGSVALVVYGCPIWALAYAILSFGVYVYLHR
jgi:hypothetical protein